MKKLTVSLPWPDRRLSPNYHGHWRGRYQASKIAKQHAYTAAFDTGIRLHGKRFRITYTFHPPNNRRRDRDNLIGACKYYQDGVFDYLGLDDHIVEDIRPRWAEVVKGGRVIVTVEIIE